MKLISQLITRTVSNMGSGVDGTVHYVHDAAGNIIAETDGTGATVREYIWLPDGGYAGTDLIVAAVDGVNTATPATYYVHTDHLSRPVYFAHGAYRSFYSLRLRGRGAFLCAAGSRRA